MRFWAFFLNHRKKVFFFFLVAQGVFLFVVQQLKNTFFYVCLPLVILDLLEIARFRGMGRLIMLELTVTVKSV